jgi:hypothetical protein
LGTCDTHYRHHINEKVTPHSQLTRANENPDFWSIYAIKLSGSSVPAVENDKTMNAPPPPSIRNAQVSYSAITQKNTQPKTAANASAAPETEESSTSSISKNIDNEDDNGMQQLNRKLAGIDLERSQFKTQQQKVEDDVITKQNGKNKTQKIIKITKQTHRRTRYTRSLNKRNPTTWDITQEYDRNRTIRNSANEIISNKHPNQRHLQEQYINDKPHGQIGPSMKT